MGWWALQEMYAEAGLLFPYLQGLDFLQPQESHHQFPFPEDDFLYGLCNDSLLDDSNSSNSHCPFPIISEPLSNLVRTSSIEDYDLAEEGDLFKAPETIIEEPELLLDPVTAAMPLISTGEDIVPTEALEVSDFVTIEGDQFLSDVFSEFRKDPLEKSSIKEQYGELSGIKFEELHKVEEQSTVRDHSAIESTLQKCVSAGCLTSTQGINDGPSRPNFLDFQNISLEADLGMRRAYSEGDIKTLSNGNIGIVNGSVPQRPLRLLSMDSYKIEERREKLSRYRKKKSKRNFGRKIKYACRKALADSQPRVRGRFAKTDECEAARPNAPM